MPKKASKKPEATDALAGFHPVTQEWFKAAFNEPTQAQVKGWAPITDGRSTLLLAPTGSGKTLAAFMAEIDRLMFAPEPPKLERCKVLYISPLKALAVDVERNLRSPLAGIAAAAERSGQPYRLPTVAIRTGDTPQSERAQILRNPPDILITTPESLYLLLTSEARKFLAFVDTVIIDEIHSMVASKRGTHLFLSLERLEDLERARAKPIQRIGLSATQRPLSEIARLLTGGTVDGPNGHWKQRDVEIVDAGARKDFDLKVEVAVEDMAKLGQVEDIPSGPAAGAGRKSIWPSIHPRLVEIIRAHRSTMIFVNSRRLAERLAAALNETAEEEIALAHHGSVAREKRMEIEDRLKRGDLPAIVATSSLELGIDMGAVDVVVQIEAPPSVASGMQRIGRANHNVGGVSRGIIFPKFRGDLLACAAATVRMKEGKVEETFYGRNPLDILAQHIVAITSIEQWKVDDLFALVRRAAPFAELPRGSFDGVLDMLSGRYPSDEFAELRPRVTWDRLAGTVRAREGARRIAVVNGGTIPDRGLYGVFLEAGDEKTSRRVGELDEEMVFESRTGDVFLLGASSWRIMEITHDRVIVAPASGEPGKMPFWHGDRPGRPVEFGCAIGELSRKLTGMSRADANKLLREEHDLDDKAAHNLVEYLQEQLAATGEVPSDRGIVIERYIDEIGDWRVCVLSPFGARIHAPWSTAVAARLRARGFEEVDSLWSDDGMVFRLPESEAPPEIEYFLPRPDEVEELIVNGLSQTSLFAARFRENAARALLLPRRHPGKRQPLWAQRKRSSDLLSVASRYGSFPMILETYRECLRDVFDLPALIDTLRQIESRKLRVTTVDTRIPSPFAASLLFSYVANFIYDGDAPLAERRAQALSVDQAQLKELLGEAELRELLDLEAITQHEAHLQRLEGSYPIKHADGLHDLLLALGDLTEDEIALRAQAPDGVNSFIDELRRDRRIITIRIAGELRLAAAEDAGRLRDALGIVPPPGLPEAFLENVPDALGELMSRYARTHGPFRTDDVAARYGLGVGPVRAALERLAARDRLLEGEFLPGGHGREWCDPEVLRAIKRRSLAKLRREVEPVEQAALGRFLVEWQEVGRKRSGLDALLSVIEQLQGTPIPASVLESEILPARIEKYRPADLDALCAAGEVIWRGLNPLGPHDGRIALYLTDRYRLLAPPPDELCGDSNEDELACRVKEILETRGAQFFLDIVDATGNFPSEVVTALWSLVWAGHITNDTIAPLRNYQHASSSKSAESRVRRAIGGRAFRSRRSGPPGSEGRWSLLPQASKGPSETERRTALTVQLLERYGVVTREAVHAEGIVGGFSAVYDVLKAMEEGGKVRRGYFVAGLGATQFAQPGADDRLRSLRNLPEDSRTVVLAATDPANPYGAALPWPETSGARPGRAAGAQVILHDGRLAAWIGRTERSLITFLPEGDPERSEIGRAIATGLTDMIDEGKRRAILISKINGVEPGESELAPYLSAAGFTAGSRGFLKR